MLHPAKSSLFVSPPEEIGELVARVRQRNISRSELIREAVL
ncbi:ribbon-helix-helix protein, CopG family [Corynebacterium cystitidis]